MPYYPPNPYQNQINAMNPINPMAFNQQSMMNNNQSLDRLIAVNGIEGAKAYQMGPNERSALFDTNEDICYIKSTDGAGFASIDIYDMQKRAPQNGSKISTDDYVTRSEFDELKGMIDDVKQYIWESQPATNNEQSDSKPNSPNRSKQNGRTQS